eukprot:Cvel_23030.t1-p1 / transcript=Cvel_23030.t1 / gene=Cvel_23030 / organism=Chromera_velia_CCMP2878 / gene_product=E-selectin, putative / transcript_product=E-selectin, putative / location=Cvel_scaffold2327:21260-29721(+) / protein_length=972 / sequence_SO=supercontig / SO=protein_coding / is_pseudo=false
MIQPFSCAHVFLLFLFLPLVQGPPSPRSFDGGRVALKGSDWTPVTLGEERSSNFEKPVVLASTFLPSSNMFMPALVKKVTSTSFEVKQQADDRTTGTDDSEEVEAEGHYLVLDAAAPDAYRTLDGRVFLARSMDVPQDGGPVVFSFSDLPTQGHAPIGVCQLQFGGNGMGDPGSARARILSVTGEGAEVVLDWGREREKGAGDSDPSLVSVTGLEGSIGCLFVWSTFGGGEGKAQVIALGNSKADVWEGKEWASKGLEDRGILTKGEPGTLWVVFSDLIFSSDQERGGNGDGNVPLWLSLVGLSAGEERKGREQVLSQKNKKTEFFISMDTGRREKGELKGVLQGAYGGSNAELKGRPEKVSLAAEETDGNEEEDQDSEEAVRRSLQVAVDECTNATFPHNCDANAGCTDTPSSFTCACNAGYSDSSGGIGTSCAAVACDEVNDSQPNTLTANVQRADSGQTGSTTATATFTYTCDSGYELSGAAGVTFSCTGDSVGVSTWKGTPPTCSAVTCDETSDSQPNTLGTGVVRTDSSQTGSTTDTATFTYNCQNGYSLDSAAAVTFTCTGDSYATSTWKGTPPTCTAASCDEVNDSQPNTLGAQVNRADSGQTGSTTATATFTYTCDNGYSLDSAAAVTFTCTGDSVGVSTWKGTPPTCSVVACNEVSDPQPNTLGTGVVRTDSSQTGNTGDTADFTFNCQNGYSLDSAATVTFSCTADSYGTSTWKGTPPTCSAASCNEVSDSQPNTLTANVQRADSGQAGSTTATATFTYTCDNGYTLDSAAAVTFSCTADSYGTSTWKGTPPTCSDINECNTNTDNCHTYSRCQNNGGSFTCECNDGYEDDSAGTDGTSCFDDSNECTVATHNCDASAACTNNVLSFTCACNLGFLDDSAGTDATSCAAVACDEVNDPQPNTLTANVQRADSSQTGNTTATATFTYTCDNGYSLDSAAAVTFSCTGDSLGVSTWKGTPPTCS